MNVKVMLVDDETEFVEMLAARLEAREFAVATAGSGSEALAKLRDQGADVVILDVVMPGQDGVETLAEIKKINPLTEVIMLTGHATVETAIEGMKRGAFDYLMKPTETEDLVAKIRKAQERKAEQEERIKQAEIKEIIGRKGW